MGFSKKKERQPRRDDMDTGAIPIANKMEKISSPSLRPIGPPPSTITSHAPSLTLKEMKPFGRLTLELLGGKNLKAGQGVFGRADPFVKIKLNGYEKQTKIHAQGGKNPVSFVKRDELTAYSTSHNLAIIFVLLISRYGTKNFRLILQQRKK